MMLGGSTPPASTSLRQGLRLRFSSFGVQVDEQVGWQAIIEEQEFHY
jgi:hypothetical protein